MKFLKIAGIVIVALIVLVFLVGSLLPEKFESEVKLTINRPPEEVWAATQDFERHPIGGKMIKRVERQPDENGLPVWTEDMGETQLHVRTLEADAPKLWKFTVEDRVVKMSFESENRIEPAAGGSRIHGVSRMSLPLKSWHAPLFRIILRISGNAGARDYWTSLAQSLGGTAEFEK
jgi:hypothetical protein